MADEKLGNATLEVITDKKEKREMKEQLDEKEGTKLVDLDEVVKFKVSYPKDYKKVKHFKDGEVTNLHIVIAKQFEELGIGKISQ